MPNNRFYAPSILPWKEWNRTCIWKPEFSKPFRTEERASITGGYQFMPRSIYDVFQDYTEMLEGIFHRSVELFLELYCICL